MKTIFLFLFSLLIFTTNNFEINNGEVLWRKVNQQSILIETLEETMIKSGRFTNLTITENLITAEIQNLPIDYKGAGESEMSIPMYIARSSINAYIVIEIKENRYRVTVKNIKLVQNYSDALSEQGEITALEVYALRKKNTEFKKGFMKKTSRILDHTFEKLIVFENDNGKW
ncbi:hypothetical protein A9Q93_09775 [Nonlabens dokdonensis]|uniref:DUF4468 domain-containing protein n=1 Tax=Nonlabens dokdonensis TaxID=328515 RepID=A0A1Z8ARD3_9FLAO|nr:hypothetical protein [Nonlabens dokdonensis]OUS12881.1 hypothetical protein A9Q93_09775 [Nonlabens dokdonensis]